MKFTNTVFVILASSFSFAYSQWTPSPLCPFPSEDLTREPFEGDCSKYWECYEGARYPMDCPEGLEFSAKESKCDDPSIANCDPDVTIIYPTYPHSTVSTASTKDPGPRPQCPFPSDDLTFFPVSTNCSQYWECYQGNSYLMSCPGELYWNPKVNQCDYPSNVDCKVVSTTPGSVTTTTSKDPTASTPAPASTTATASTPATTTTVPTQSTTASSVCSDQPDGTYLSDPDDCSKFYECVGGKPTEGQCPGDLVWNAAVNSCDYRENVNCDKIAAI